MNKFANLVVHLNEDNIDEVKELLISKGEKLNSYLFAIGSDSNFNYLYFNTIRNDWGVTCKLKSDNEITLEQFKRLINEK